MEKLTVKFSPAALIGLNQVKGRRGRKTGKDILGCECNLVHVLKARESIKNWKILK